MRHFADMAPCAAPKPSALFAERSCASPHVPLGDGVYVDNTAVAMVRVLRQAGRPVPRRTRLQLRRTLTPSLHPSAPLCAFRPSG